MCIEHANLFLAMILKQYFMKIIYVAFIQYYIF